MRKNKIGVVFLVSALALAGIGFSYAGFTDTITVSGSVGTATVDLVVTGYSNTYVFKIYNFIPNVNPPVYIGLTVDPDHEIAIFHGPSTVTPTYIMGLFAGYCTIEYESGANAMQAVDNNGPINDEVYMQFFNLFPCIDFTADFVVHYVGSIPVKVNVADWLTYTGWLLNLYNAGAVTITANFLNPDGTIGGPVTIGTQIHNSQSIIVALTIHIPQDNVWQSQDGAFTAHVGVIQWNEG